MDRFLKTAVFFPLEHQKKKIEQNQYKEQFYLNNPNIPNKIMIRDEIEDKETIEK